jgi:mRNA-degrading endonuclease toxin of MazEF toxin-antitoxin module
VAVVVAAAEVRESAQRGVSVVSLNPRAIVVPMTTKRRNRPTRFRVAVHRIEGDAMCEQVRPIGVSRLEDDRDGRVAPDVLRDFQQTIAQLIGVC